MEFYTKFLFLSLFAVTVWSLSSPVPLFLWTGENYFPINHVELTNAISLEDLESSLVEVAKTASSTTAPEVLVAFLAEKMGSSDIAQLGAAYTTDTSQDKLPALKELLTSQNSFVAPHVYTNGEKTSNVLSRAVQSVSTYSASGQIIKFNLQNNNCDALLNTLESNSVCSNGALDLVLVSFSDYQAQQVDQCLQRVQTSLNSKCQQRYISLLSAEETNEPKRTFLTERVENDLLSFTQPSFTTVSAYTNKRTLFAAVNGTTPVFVGPQYMSSAILFGILLGFVLLFFVWQGVSQLTSIQTPVRFSHTKLQLSREY